MRFILKKDKLICRKLIHSVQVETRSMKSYFYLRTNKGPIRHLRFLPPIPVLRTSVILHQGLCPLSFSIRVQDLHKFKSSLSSAAVRDYSFLYTLVCGFLRKVSCRIENYLQRWQTHRRRRGRETKESSSTTPGSPYVCHRYPRVSRCHFVRIDWDLPKRRTFGNTEVGFYVPTFIVVLDLCLRSTLDSCLCHVLVTGWSWW